jgi:hypothetical protein
MSCCLVEKAMLFQGRYSLLAILCLGRISRRPADNLHQFSGYDCLKNALLAQSGMALKLSLEEAHIQLLSK